MKEHPILFKAEMVRAIIDGQKTQTRRVVTRQNAILDGHKRPNAEHWKRIALAAAWIDPGPSPAGNVGPYLKAECDCRGPEEGIVHRLYPQWSIGQRLWVRETWMDLARCPDGGYILGAKAGGGDWTAYPPKGFNGLPNRKSGHWRPSIFMPRWASRITLEVTEVRVQRVNEISEADARAEGIEHHDGGGVGWSARGEFEYLWDSINAKRGFGWNLNPWIWALTFKRIGS